jgi:glyoxylase-like metal-dependent hydrolase (beta-lactamase superfamily II)/rhodanese-related sulfurtransferase
MYFRQFYLGCLAHASYLIGSNGEAAVVDPQRDVEEYIREARRQGQTIRHIIETHLHADFVSGHRELAARTGARIYYGAGAGVKFEHQPVREGDEIRMGDVLLRFLETPGHTPESICVLFYDLANSTEPRGVLTGDTLFVGDVGRPDLLSSRLRPSDLAGMLYDSLHRRLLTLPDNVKVYPAHGAGSLCGRNISSESSSTIGHERRFNYALQPMTRDQFVALLTVDLPEAPPYFSADVELNRSGPPLLGSAALPACLDPAQVERAVAGGCTVLDTRPAVEYGAGHIPNSMNIGLGGQFATWCGTLMPPDSAIIIVAESEESMLEARVRLARVGLENVAGYLGHGISAWNDSGRCCARVEQIPVDELRARLDDGGAPCVLDVRRPAEWNAGHIPGALHVPLHRLRERAASLDRRLPTAVICAGGYRSSMGTGILEQLGFARPINVVGGMTAWTTANLSITR